MNWPAHLAPGSLAAIQRHGCTCDPRLNNYGAGDRLNPMSAPLHHVAADCPFHRPDPQPARVGRKES